MAPSGEKLLEANVTCSSGGSLKEVRKLNVRDAPCYIHVILVFTIVISESRGGKIRIVLVCDSCQLMLTLLECSSNIMERCGEV